MMDNVMQTRTIPPDTDPVLASGWAAFAQIGILPAADGGARDFLACASRAGPVLQAAGLPGVADAVALHSAYLADKRHLAAVSLLPDTEPPDDLLIHDAILNIALTLRQALDAAKLRPLPSQPDAGLPPAAITPPRARGEPASAETGSPPTDPADRSAPPAARAAEAEARAADAELREAGVPAGVLALIKAAEQHLQGWCSRAKALAMSRLVLAEQPQVCVEIGVFGGRSLIPCAAALAANGTGHIYGIECWDPQEAVRNAMNPANDAWWLNIDFAAIKHAFVRFVVDHQLTVQVRILETSSRHVAGMFGAIDFLHIDGSHAVIGAAEDVLLYATKVRPGGIIVFDDANWDTTQAAQQMLAAMARPLMTEAEVTDANYAVYRRT
jgi:predicted O-methyltransferase YrrM